MSLGIGRDPNCFAESFVCRYFQKVRHRRIRNFGYILRCCLLLREQRSGTQHQSNGKSGCETTLHWSLPKNFDETGLLAGKLNRRRVYQTTFTKLRFYGRPTRRTISWKTGSDLTGSWIGLALRSTRDGERSS